MTLLSLSWKDCPVNLSHSSDSSELSWRRPKCSDFLKNYLVRETECFVDANVLGFGNKALVAIHMKLSRFSSEVFVCWNFEISREPFWRIFFVSDVPHIFLTSPFLQFSIYSFEEVHFKNKSRCSRNLLFSGKWTSKVWKSLEQWKSGPKIQTLQKTMKKNQERTKMFISIRHKRNNFKSLASQNTIKVQMPLYESDFR